MGDPGDPLAREFSVVLEDFTWNAEDGSSLNVDAGKYKLEGIDIRRLTRETLWKELEERHNVVMPTEKDNVHIGVQMCKCIDLKVKAHNDLVFPHLLDSGHDIVLHIKMVDNTTTSEVGDNVEGFPGTKKRKFDDIRGEKTTKKSSKGRKIQSKQLSEPCGLVNQGVVCYANSIFQCYSFTEPLVAYLFGDGYGEKCGLDSKCFLCDLRRLIEDSRTRKVINPKNLTRYILDLGEKFDISEQQGPHEFLTATNGIMETSSKNHGLNIVEDLYPFHMVYEYKCRRYQKVWEDTPFRSPILPLPIQDDEHKTCASMEQGLDLYFRKERWPHVKCAKCGKEDKVRRRLLISSPPKILTVEFNRLETKTHIVGGESVAYTQKIQGCVKIPTKLNISPFMTSNSHKDRDTSYDLYCVIVHKGSSLQGGHYKAYVKTHNDTWYCCNDKKVVKKDPESISNLEGFVMFYKRNDTVLTQVAGEVAQPQPTKQHVEEGDDINAESSIAPRETSQEEQPRQEEHELEHSQEHEQAKGTTIGKPSTPRTLSEEDIKNNMEEQYIIAQDRCRETVMKKIKEALKFCDRKQRKYEFKVPSFRAPVYNPLMGHFCLPRIHGRCKRRSTQNPATAKKAMRIFFILKTILENLKENETPMCQKEIFYKDASLFERDSKQKSKGSKDSKNKVKDSKDSKNKVKDSKEEEKKKEKKEKRKDYKVNFIPLMTEVGILLETTRLSLGVSAKPRGYIVGDIKLYINGVHHDCRHGQVISDKSFQITRIKTKGKIKFILIVEKYTIYHKLKEMGFDKKHNCIIVTPRGFPTVAARALVRKLWELVQVRIYGLVDLNASGASILSTFMIGSISRAFDNLGLSVPAIQWIGVFPSDLDALKDIPQTPMSSNDITKLQNLQKVYKDNRRPRQANLLNDCVQHGCNVDIDAILDSCGGIEKYLSSKIKEMVVIKKKSKKRKKN